MKKRLLIVGMASLLFSNATLASCVGGGSFYSCFDSGSGNSYSVQRYGNQTYLNGYNGRTGSSWSQNSYSYGNGFSSSFGRSANGNSWSQYTTPYSSFGNNSSGRSYYSTSPYNYGSYSNSYRW